MVRRRDAADGPLAPYVAGFGEKLAFLGYSGRAASQHLELLADLSAWLAQEGLAAAELTASQTARFLGGRRERGYRELTTPVGAGPLLDYLIGLGVVPLPARPAPAGPADALLERYREYLVSQRGLTAGEVGLARGCGQLVRRLGGPCERHRMGRGDGGGRDPVPGQGVRRPEQGVGVQARLGAAVLPAFRPAGRLHRGAVAAGGPAGGHLDRELAAPLGPGRAGGGPAGKL